MSAKSLSPQWAYSSKNSKKVDVAEGSKQRRQGRKIRS